MDYDSWFDYLKLLMNEDVNRAEIEDCFERAIANIPLYMACFLIFVFNDVVLGETLLASIHLALDLLCSLRRAASKGL